MPAQPDASFSTVLQQTSIATVEAEQAEQRLSMRSGGGVALASTSASAVTAESLAARPRTLNPSELQLLQKKTGSPTGSSGWGASVGSFLWGSASKRTSSDSTPTSSQDPQQAGGKAQSPRQEPAQHHVAVRSIATRKAAAKESSGDESSEDESSGGDEDEQGSSGAAPSAASPGAGALVAARGAAEAEAEAEAETLRAELARLKQGYAEAQEQQAAQTERARAAEHDARVKQAQGEAELTVRPSAPAAALPWPGLGLASISPWTSPWTPALPVPLAQVLSAKVAALSAAEASGGEAARQARAAEAALSSQLLELQGALKRRSDELLAAQADGRRHAAAADLARQEKDVLAQAQRRLATELEESNASKVRDACCVHDALAPLSTPPSPLQSRR